MVKEIDSALPEQRDLTCLGKRQVDAEQTPASEQLDSLQRLINRDVRGNDKKVSLSFSASSPCIAESPDATRAPKAPEISV